MEDLLKCVKVTNKELMQSVKALEELSQRDMPVKGAFWMGKIMRHIARAIDDYNAARHRLNMQFVKRDEQKNPVTVDSPMGKQFDFGEHAEAQQQAFNELNAIEITLHFPPFKVGDLGPAPISPSIFVLTHWLFEPLPDEQPATA